MGRIHKTGRLDEKMFIATIKKPAVIKALQYSWTIIDASVEKSPNGLPFAYGQLSKFDPEGVVAVVDEPERAQDQKPEPNLLAATSPFVYIPEFSGIAFLHVWNQIEANTFIRRFCDVVHKTHGEFFVNCEIELISDLRSFVAKLRSMQGLLDIAAHVNPPNPLFGRVWKNLREYLERRRAGRLEIREKAKDENAPLQSQLIHHATEILHASETSPYEPAEPIDTTDAAILMAADGYGKGRVIGKVGKSQVVVRTADAQLSFAFSKTPKPQELYEEARKHFSRINTQRGMSHNE